MFTSENLIPTDRCNLDVMDYNSCSLPCELLKLMYQSTRLTVHKELKKKKDQEQTLKSTCKKAIGF